MKSPITPDRRGQQQHVAFTLIELLAVITIIAVLASVVFVLSMSLRKKAERVQCGENLKTLHMALSTYLTDHQRWPQVREGIDNEEAYWQVWAEKLEAYELPDSVWMCPTHKRVTKDEFLRFSSYHPMPFDGSSVYVPHYWPNMPWVIEIGDNHGKGPLMVMPDGSIQTAEYSVDKPFDTVKKR